MKKIIVFILLTIVLVGGAFAETRMVTVKQFMRYSKGQYAELLSPQISKAKAIKSNKGKVFLKYDFFIENSSSLYDVVAYIYVPAGVPIYPTSIEGAKPIEQVLAELEEDTSDWTIVQECLVTNVYRTTSEDSDFIECMLHGKKGTKATVEFLLDVSDWMNDTMPVLIKFYPQTRRGAFMGTLRNMLVLPLIKDIVTGEFSSKSYDDSERLFTLLITE